MTDTQHKRLIKCRLEELPTLAQFLIDSLTRDFSEFAAYKPPRYGGSRVGDFTAKKTAVSAAVNPKQLTAEQKVITGRIMTNRIAGRQPVNLLEGYVEDADKHHTLTISKKDFGIHQVRVCLSNDDLEGLDEAFNYLLANITNNLTPLENEGFTTGQQTTLSDLHDNLNTDNALQNAKEGQRALLVVSNLGTVRELEVFIQETGADGRHQYKASNPTKMKDYVISQLINRMRQDQLRTKVVGNVLKQNGQPGKKVEVRARKVGGGRGKTVKVKADGSYEIAGLDPTSYNITVLVNKVPVANGQVDVVTGETETLNFQVPN